MASTSYNFLDMLREASTDAADKTFKLQFEVVYGGQSSFAGISFDRYLPTTVVVVSVLVAFNFFRSALLACLGDVHFLLPFTCFIDKFSDNLQQSKRVFPRQQSASSRFHAARCFSLPGASFSLSQLCHQAGPSLNSSAQGWSSKRLL